MMVLKRYPKGSAWKRANWDKWSTGRKIRHVIAVISAAAIVIIMWAAFLYVVFIMFGIQGFLLKFRDFILLEIMHWLFG